MRRSAWKMGAGVVLLAAGCTDAASKQDHSDSNAGSGGSSVASAGSAGSISSGGAASGSGGATGSGGTTGGTLSSGGTTGGMLSSAGTGGNGSGSGGAGTAYVSDLCVSGTPTNAWGPVERDVSNGEQAENDGGPLSVDGTIYDKGIGVHAPADLGIGLAGACSSFAATVGIDDEMRAAGSVIFEVWGDGAMLYQSDPVTGADAGLPIEVDISGVQELHLIANENGGNGSDHADWADARVTCTTLPSQCLEPVAEIPVPPGYHLVWSDEFDVNGAPNGDNWDFEQGFVRNEEAQWYQPDNANVQAGFLIIDGRREQVPNPNYQAGSNDWKTNRQFAEYTSSSLHSRGRQSFQYGRFEMRGRIVTEAGLWPAFWTLGNSGEWPSNGEVDIMEFYGGQVRANVATGTSTRWVAKWDSVARAVSSFGDDDWDAKFHVWRMDWDDQNIVLSLDGETLNTTALADMLNPNGQSPFKQPAYILLNLAIGGPNGGDPSNTDFPSRYEVDYVRVFQQD